MSCPSCSGWYRHVAEPPEVGSPDYEITQPKLPVLKMAEEGSKPAQEADSPAVEAAKPVDKTMPMSQEDLESAVKSGAAADEAADPDEKTMTMSADDLKAALKAGSPAVEAEKPVEKTVPIQREKIATDGDDDAKPKGRLLPWESDSPQENSDSGDKEVSD